MAGNTLDLTTNADQALKHHTLSKVITGAVVIHSHYPIEIRDS